MKTNKKKISFCFWDPRFSKRDFCLLLIDGHVLCYIFSSFLHKTINNGLDINQNDDDDNGHDVIVVVYHHSMNMFDIVVVVDYDDDGDYYYTNLLYQMNMMMIMSY